MSIRYGEIKIPCNPLTVPNDIKIISCDTKERGIDGNQNEATDQTSQDIFNDISRLKDGSIPS